MTARGHILPLPAEETRHLRELVERPERVSFWGKEYTITPRLIAHVFGDGRRLMAITPLATRPNYFVARVDSTVTDPLDPFPASSQEALLDHIMEAAEEEYGNIRHADEDERGSFPTAVDWGIGCTWGTPVPIAAWRTP